MTETRPTLPRELNAFELRVLGTLIEKSLATPEQYPLSLNATKVGCNQKTSREPVVNYEERTVGGAFRDLIELKLVREVYPPERGAMRYEHRLANVLDLRAPAVALLGVLMLRGAQTLGELRQNCQRMHAFDSIDHVQDALDRLATREPPLILQLARAPGQREERYCHLLGGHDAALKQAASSPISYAAALPPARVNNDEVAELRREMQELKARVVELEAFAASLQ